MRVALVGSVMMPTSYRSSWSRILAFAASTAACVTVPTSAAVPTFFAFDDSECW